MHFHFCALETVTSPETNDEMSATNSRSDDKEEQHITRKTNESTEEIELIRLKERHQKEFVAMKKVFQKKQAEIEQLQQLLEEQKRINRRQKLEIDGLKQRNVKLMMRANKNDNENASRCAGDFCSILRKSQKRRGSSSKSPPNTSRFEENEFPIRSKHRNKKEHQSKSRNESKASNAPSIPEDGLANALSSNRVSVAAEQLKQDIQSAIVHLGYSDKSAEEVAVTECQPIAKRKKSKGIQGDCQKEDKIQVPRKVQKKIQKEKREEASWERKLRELKDRTPLLLKLI